MLLKQVDILLENANTIPNWFYRRVWQSKQHKHNLVHRYQEQVLTLIFADGLGLGTSLVEELSRQNQAFAQVTIGSDFAQISANHYEIVPGNQQHYDLLLNSLKQLPRL